MKTSASLIPEASEYASVRRDISLCSNLWLDN